MTSREYERRRKAETDLAIAEGRDPNDFKRNSKGEILFCLFIEGLYLSPIRMNRCEHGLEHEIMSLIDQHRGENQQMERIDDLILLYIDVPEPEVEPLIAALSDVGCWVENLGRINPSGIPEKLD
jgi:hypothetical protein